MTLTPKQEHFSQLLASPDPDTGRYRSATLTYQLAYSTENMSPHAIEVEASRLALHPDVSLRIQQLKSLATDAFIADTAWDLDRLVRETTQNLLGARQSKQWGSANGAVEIIGRATGILNDKHQQSQAPITSIIIHMGGAESPSIVESVAPAPLKPGDDAIPEHPEALESRDTEV